MAPFKPSDGLGSSPEALLGTYLILHLSQYYACFLQPFLPRASLRQAASTASSPFAQPEFQSNARTAVDMQDHCINALQYEAGSGDLNVTTIWQVSFAGRVEFTEYFPENTQGVLVQPVGDEGILVAATDTQRGFGRLDQVRSPSSHRALQDIESCTGDTMQPDGSADARRGDSSTNRYYCRLTELWHASRSVMSSLQ